MREQGGRYTAFEGRESLHTHMALRRISRLPCSACDWYVSVGRFALRHSFYYKRAFLHQFSPLPSRPVQPGQARLVPLLTSFRFESSQTTFQPIRVRHSVFRSIKGENFLAQGPRQCQSRLVCCCEAKRKKKSSVYNNVCFTFFRFDAFSNFQSRQKFSTQAYAFFSHSCFCYSVSVFFGLVAIYISESKLFRINMQKKYFSPFLIHCFFYLGSRALMKNS